VRPAFAAAAAITAIVIAAACARDPEDRRTVLEVAQRENYEITQDSVVQLLRAPHDSGRIVYDDPTDLSERTAAARGSEQVWAPFGIAQPDTVDARGRARTQPDTAGISR
jgi:hypothetical protein